MGSILHAVKEDKRYTILFNNSFLNRNGYLTHLAFKTHTLVCPYTTIIKMASLSSSVALSTIKDIDTSQIILLFTPDSVKRQDGSGSIQIKTWGSPLASCC